MTKLRREYCIVEHIWRLIRGLLIFVGTMYWLMEDGFQSRDAVVLGCFVLVIIWEQIHGIACYYIESLLKYKHQHDKYE